MGTQRHSNSGQRTQTTQGTLPVRFHVMFGKEGQTLVMETRKRTPDGASERLPNIAIFFHHAPPFGWGDG